MLSEKEFRKLREYIFLKQKENYKRNNLRPIRKRFSSSRKETNKMLYSNFVIIEE